MTLNTNDEITPREAAALTAAYEQALADLGPDASQQEINAHVLLTTWKIVALGEIEPERRP